MVHLWCRCVHYIGKHRHYIGSRHRSVYCHSSLFKYVPGNFTGTIAGNRHYLTGTIEDHHSTFLPFRRTPPSTRTSSTSPGSFRQTGNPRRFSSGDRHIGVGITRGKRGGGRLETGVFQGGKRFPSGKGCRSEHWHDKGEQDGEGGGGLER